MSECYNEVKERFLRYVKINTQSANGTGRMPSTECQWDLARVLRDELNEIGCSDVMLDEKYCVVYGKIPGSPGLAREEPVGLIAHIDTAPDASGENVKPWVLENYQGEDIALNKEKGIVMKAEDFPNLKDYLGQDLVLTDGTTLLGGDDKASIAAIMTMAKYLIAHPELPHVPVSIAFTPDEEVGGLAGNLDLTRFGSRTAYTLDGDHLGYYTDETFNASQADVEIYGRSVHTGTAKGIMINASDIAAEFLAMLPAAERPQCTEGREGFYHVTNVNASCEYARVTLIIRDHDAGKFSEREEFVRECARKLNEKYCIDAGNGPANVPGTVRCTIKESYRNMKEKIDEVPDLVPRLVRAIEACGLEAKTEPFRGGTDGSSLSWRGLPCPNLSAGYENAHGRFEYVPVQSMEKNVEILLELVKTGSHAMIT
ncbi:MAG: peptidase T [Lachnospiraceae bacterium]|nr:peptidase T [Lachnospiraceae bacterium]